MPYCRAAATAVLLALSLAPRPASAQLGRSGGLLSGPIAVGARAGRDFENHAWSLGGQASAMLGHNFELRPSGDLFFPRHGKTAWQLNGDADIRIGQGGGLYAGGGIALFHPGGGGKTSTGYNLFFGLTTAPPLQRVKPFAEFRWTFVNHTSPFRLALGFDYRL
jgi:hypothetical protein